MADTTTKIGTTSWKAGWEERLVIVMVFLAIASIPAIIWKSYETKRKWLEFAAAHRCKIVAKVRGDVDIGTGYGITANGTPGLMMTTIDTPPRTAWHCDDGVTYWR